MKIKNIERHEIAMIIDGIARKKITSVEKVKKELLDLLEKD